MTDLLISIVTYAPDLNKFRTTIDSLERAVNRAIKKTVISTVHLVVVDNGPGDSWLSLLEREVAELKKSHCSIGVEILSGHGNIGFGGGNNLAPKITPSKYYLVLNPDVAIDRDAISHAVEFLESHPEVGLISTSVINSEGEQQFLCKRFPSLLVLAVRGIGFSWLRRLFHHRIADYEMRDICCEKTSWQRVPIVSGCFMLFRRSIWDKCCGFSSDFFMYFEDFDLSLRVGKLSQVAYLPMVKIVHMGGGHAARKGWKHIKMFVRSGYTFFNKYGWRVL